MDTKCPTIFRENRSGLETKNIKIVAMANSTAKKSAKFKLSSNAIIMLQFGKNRTVASVGKFLFSKLTPQVENNCIEPP